MNRGICAALVLGLLAGTARAQDDEGWVKYRHNLMEGIGHDMGAIGDILKNGLPLGKNIAVHAQSIADHGRLIAAAFEKNARSADDRALPEIWTDAAGFAAAIEKFQKEADAFAALAKSGEMGKIGAGMQALGKTCGACHEGYRKPEEESGHH